MKILLINNVGAGFADYLEVEAGTTVAKLFGERMVGCRADDYLIRVNRLPAARDQVLAEGDRISFTPSKIEGACDRCHRRTFHITAGRRLVGRKSTLSQAIGLAKDAAITRLGQLVKVRQTRGGNRRLCFAGLNIATTGPVAVRVA